MESHPNAFVAKLAGRDRGHKRTGERKPFILCKYISCKALMSPIRLSGLEVSLATNDQKERCLRNGQRSVIGDKKIKFVIPLAPVCLIDTGNLQT